MSRLADAKAHVGAVVSASYEDKRARSQVVDDLLRERGFYAEADALKRDPERPGITWRDVTDYAEVAQAGYSPVERARWCVALVERTLATTRLPWPGVTVALAVVEYGDVHLRWRADGVGEVTSVVGGRMFEDGLDSNRAIRMAIEYGWRELATGALFGGG